MFSYPKGTYIKVAIVCNLTPSFRSFCQYYPRNSVSLKTSPPKEFPRVNFSSFTFSTLRKMFLPKMPVSLHSEKYFRKTAFFRLFFWLHFCTAALSWFTIGDTPVGALIRNLLVVTIFGLWLLSAVPVSIFELRVSNHGCVMFFRMSQWKHHNSVHAEPKVRKRVFIRQMKTHQIHRRHYRSQRVQISCMFQNYARTCAMCLKGHAAEAKIDSLSSVLKTGHWQDKPVLLISMAHHRCSRPQN